MIEFPKDIIKTNREGSRFGKYRFPQDLGPNAMVIDFQKYSYKRSTQGVDPNARTVTSIVLPLPQQIQDAYNLILGEQQLGVGGAFILDQFSDNPTSLGNVLGSIENIGRNVAAGDIGELKDIVGGAGQYAKFLSRSILDSLPIEGLSLATDLVTGSAVNPHTTLNFDGVNLKSFEFNWQLAPRSQKESDELKNIVRKIKSHILPKYSTLPNLAETGSRATDRALLKYPDLAIIRFNGLAKDHFFQFKPGMINNLSIDYSPNGNVFLEGGKPAIVNLRMSFMEAQIHTSGKYEGSTELEGRD